MTTTKSPRRKTAGVAAPSVPTAPSAPTTPTLQTKRAPEAEPHEHLRRVEPKLAPFIERHGPSPLIERAKSPQASDLHFAGLVQAIVSQQLSGKAADTIFGRLVALGGGALPDPAALMAIPDDKLRAVGLSGAKARGVKDLAARVAAGSLRLEEIHQSDDEAVIEALTKVKGIGRWTAEMFLMFRLGRLDILSTADLGLRKGMMHLFGLDDLPDARRMEELAAPWRPFRSVGSWYLWRVAEGTPPHRTKEKAPSIPAAKKELPAKKAAAKKPAMKKAAAKKAASKKPAAKKPAAKLSARRARPNTPKR